MSFESRSEGKEMSELLTKEERKLVIGELMDFYLAMMYADMMNTKAKIAAAQKATSAEGVSQQV
jgi:hypothetical protein